MTQERTYLDWNATAPLCAPARRAMIAALDLAGNASSVHAEGRKARALIEAARRDVAMLLGASPSCVVFTGGATEAANLVLTPDFRMGRSPLAIGALYHSAIEHPAVREGGRFDAGRVHEIPVLKSGIVDLGALKAMLAAHDPGLGPPMVAIMHANNETGIVQPVREAAALTAEAGGIFVVDAAQTAGRLPLSIDDIGCDFMIVSAHKIGGPKGVGALIARGEILMPAPLIRGGGQERGHRAGTEDIAAIAGFAAAARLMAEDIGDRNAAVARLRDRFEAGMREAAADVEIIGADAPRLPNTSLFRLLGQKAETGRIAFDLEGVSLSAGSACSSGRTAASHVLTAMGMDGAMGALRASIGPQTCEADIERALEVFRTVASRRQAPPAAA